MLEQIKTNKDRLHSVQILNIFISQECVATEDNTKNEHL